MDPFGQSLADAVTHIGRLVGEARSESAHPERYPFFSLTSWVRGVVALSNKTICGIVDLSGEAKTGDDELLKPGLTKADLKRLEQTPIDNTAPDPFGDIYRAVQRGEKPAGSSYVIGAYTT